MTLPLHKKLLYTAIAVAGFFALIEGILRLFLFRYQAPRPSLIVWSPDMDGRIADPRHTFRFHRECFWEPRPNAGYFDLNVDYGFINQSGFRGPDYALARSPNSYRIACFGDSSTFGMLVHEPETYPRRLEQRLRSATGRDVEVINAGVIGYTAFQGFARYRARVQPYRPDLIILSFGAINDGLPASQLPDQELARRTARIWSVEPTLLSPLAQLRIVQLALWLNPGRHHATAARQRTVLEYERSRRKFERGEPYVPRVALPDFERILNDWISAAQADDTRVVLISPPRETGFEREHPQFIAYNQAVERIAASRRVPCVDVRSRFAAGTPDLLLDNVHPSPTGHQQIADQLAEPVLSLLEPRDNASH